jgi:hypothetical protein
VESNLALFSSSSLEMKLLVPELSLFLELLIDDFILLVLSLDLFEEWRLLVFVATLE